MEQEKVTPIISILEQVTELLYQENIMPAYTRLAAVLPALEGIIMSFEDETQKELKEKLQSTLAAMEDADHTLVADILQYEIIEQLKEYTGE